MCPFFHFIPNWATSNRKKKGGGRGISQPMPIPSTPTANTPLFPFFHGKKLLSPESQGQKIYTILYPISEIGTLILCLDGERVDG